MPEIFDAKNKQEPTKRTHGNSKTNSKSNSLHPPHTTKCRDKIHFKSEYTMTVQICTLDLIFTHIIQTIMHSEEKSRKLAPLIRFGICTQMALIVLNKIYLIPKGDL